MCLYVCLFVLSLLCLEDVVQLIDIGINESDDDFIFKVIKNYNDFSDKLKNLFMRIIHRRPYVKYVNLFLKYTDIDFSDGNYIIPRKIATYGYLNIFKRLMKEKNLVKQVNDEVIERVNIKKNVTGKKINSVEVLIKVASDNQNQN